MRQAKRLCGAAGVGVVVVVALVVVGAFETRAGARPAQLVGLDHFLCYAVDPFGTFQPRTVTVADQFRRARVRLERIQLLCNPVQKNRVLVRNPRAHLVCYAHRAQAVTPRRAEFRHQLGRVLGTVVSRQRLCLPSGKAVRGVPRPVTGLDHFACYAIRVTSQPGPRTVSLRDQFGSFRATVRRTLSVCAPASKNGGRVVNRRAHLTCAIIEPLTRPGAGTVSYTNQFVRGGRLAAVRPVLLCLPSSKRVTVLRPDLTVAITGPPSVSCLPGGCTTTITFTISNPSATNVTTAFDVLVEADPGQSRTISVAGLAAGASQTFTETLGPGGNCFDPDCTVRVTVDSGNVVVESNEANNVATLTSVG